MPLYLRRVPGSTLTKTSFSSCARLRCTARTTRNEQGTALDALSLPSAVCRVLRNCAHIALETHGAGLKLGAISHKFSTAAVIIIPSSSNTPNSISTRSPNQHAYTISFPSPSRRASSPTHVNSQLTKAEFTVPTNLFTVSSETRFRAMRRRGWR